MAWRQLPRTETSETAKVNALRLRRSMTDSEKTLWKHLRDLTDTGTHFRRQVPVGRYVADFCCLGHRLIVELDGPIHETPDAARHDRTRTEYLNAQGFRVLRFTNEDVTLRRDEILKVIKGALVATTPTPGPSPQGGGEYQGATA